MKVSNIFETTVPSGTNITFTMNQMYLDYPIHGTTDSWILTTLTSDGYEID
jgi:hypothetical protein